MVNAIDIHKLTLEELNGVVDLYPWYGGARMELCRRMAALGALSESQVARTALHISSRRLLYDLVKGGKKADCSDKDAKTLIESYISSPSPAAEPKRVHVVGGDYFSQAEYDSVRQSDDRIFSRFATKAREEGYTDTEDDRFMDFCTETLAKIYLEQDYREQAIDIYSKLSLRYPEKSVYFASLIDEIKQKEQ